MKLIKYAFARVLVRRGFARLGRVFTVGRALDNRTQIKMASDIQDLLQPHLRSIRVPNAGDKVFKDECAFSFDTPVIIESNYLVRCLSCTCRLQSRCHEFSFNIVNLYLSLSDFVLSLTGI